MKPASLRCNPDLFPNKILRLRLGKPGIVARFSRAVVLAQNDSGNPFPKLVLDSGAALFYNSP